jgi:hypothetical protein
MMKKLLIVFTVLAMASVTNAALLISVDGVENPADSDIELYPSDTAVLDMDGDGQTPIPPNIAVWWVVEGPGTISGGAVLYGGSLADHYTYVPGTGDGYEDVKAWLELSVPDGGGGFVEIGGLAYTTLADGAAVPKPLSGKLVDDILFHCEKEGEVVVTIIDSELGHVFDTQVIHQIPEPMTLGLLGLGGLFLRRRK